MQFDIHAFTLMALGLLGGALWRFYTLINQRFDEKINRIEDRFVNFEKSIDEIKADIKEVKQDIRRLDHKVSDMDKQIAILQVNINHIYLPRPNGFSDSHEIVKNIPLNK